MGSIIDGSFQSVLGTFSLGFAAAFGYGSYSLLYDISTRTMSEGAQVFEYLGASATGILAALFAIVGVGNIVSGAKKILNLEDRFENSFDPPWWYF